MKRYTKTYSDENDRRRLIAGKQARYHRFDDHDITWPEMGIFLVFVILSLLLWYGIGMVLWRVMRGF